MTNYFKITNSKGKVWIMPSRHMKVGMLLYQPSGWKGKMLKKIFPLFHKIKIIRKCLHISECSCPINNTLSNLLKHIFNAETLEYSWFGGTPNKHQKITIQIFDGEKILGYCKLTSSLSVYDLFQKEQNYLLWLKDRNVRNVPVCLYCGILERNQFVFIQSTEKTLSSIVNHTLGTIEMLFLSSLEKKTMQRMAYIDSDQYKSVERMKSCIGYLNTSYSELVLSLIKNIEDYYSSNRECFFAAYHSDFTPWNMFIEKAHLFVFDFEYARRSYMPFLDIFHYIFQTEIFEKKSSAYRIYEKLIESKNKFEKYFDNYLIAISLYLIDVIGFYLERDCGIIDKQQVIRLNVVALIIDQNDCRSKSA